jgi:2'-5' RNA ligase
MIENLERVHVAVPLPQEMYLAWTVGIMRMIERGRFPEMKGPGNLPHMTIYHLGDISIGQFAKADRIVLENSGGLVNSKLRVIGLSIIGSGQNQALAFTVESTKELKKFRKELEKYLPEYAEHNYPLLPHFTITELRTRRSIERARKMVLESLPKRNLSEPTKVRQVLVYHS